MADRQPTPEELHYGRAAYAAANPDTCATLPFDALSLSTKRYYAAVAAAARSAPTYHNPAEYLYSSLMDAVAAQSERTSPREDRAIVCGVAHWLRAHGPNLSPSDISDLYDLAKERK